MPLTKHYPVVFGLGFDIQPDPVRLSGFSPAHKDGSGQALFADLRLRAFAAAYHSGFAAHLYIVCGPATYLGDRVFEIDGKRHSPLSQAFVIKRMLTHDFEIPADFITEVPSQKSTQGNVGAIKRLLEERRLDSHECRFITNGYHVGRSEDDFEEAGIPMRGVPAEVLVIADIVERYGDSYENAADAVATRLGGGALANREALEFMGRAKKLLGAFVPRETGAKI